MKQVGVKQGSIAKTTDKTIAGQRADGGGITSMRYLAAGGGAGLGASAGWGACVHVGHDEGCHGERQQATSVRLVELEFRAGSTYAQCAGQLAHVSAQGLPAGSTPSAGTAAACHSAAASLERRKSLQKEVEGGEDEQ